MKNTIRKRTLTASVGLALVALTAGSANAAVLYNIATFNNDGSSNTSTQWKVGITTITTTTGLTGTDDAGLVTLQTLQADPVTAPRTASPRFSNQDSARLTGTVIIDPSASGYAQFGIVADSGNTIDLSSLTFQTTRATTSGATRGYDIDISVNGAAYVALGAANVTNNRNDGLEAVVLSLTDTGITSVDFQISSTGGGVEYTNFAINGEVITIPEPSAALLGALGLLGLFRRRRA